jgi:molybdopterin-binding protein
VTEEPAAAACPVAWGGAGKPLVDNGKEFPMKLSARNVLKGKVVSVEKGATTAHVKIEIANGQTVTSSITNESVEALGLQVGSDAYAVIKSSDVIIAVD